MDQKLLKEITELADAYPKNASSQLTRSKKYKKHLEFLCEHTSFAPFGEYSVSEKIWLLKNGMDRFPKCEKCGKPLDRPNNFIGLTRGFHRFCSDTCSANSQSTRDQCRNTVKSRYGVDNVFQSQDVKSKCRKTCMAHYGVEVSTLDHGVMRKQRQSGYRYAADGIAFDSSLECCFYVYCRDNGIACEYSPAVSFEYEYNGRTYRYFPDFRVGNGIVEIKGKHFFKDGKMICPFRDKLWSDKTYAEVCGRYEAKHQCMLRHSVVILTEDDMCREINYMKEKYGARWRSLFRGK